jgi:hypothetical protein
MSDQAIEEFRVKLRRAFQATLEGTVEKIPYTERGFARLLVLAEPLLPIEWRRHFRIVWVEPTPEHRRAGKLPEPEIIEIKDDQSLI